MLNKLCRLSLYCAKYGDTLTKLHFDSVGKHFRTVARHSLALEHNVACRNLKELSLAHFYNHLLLCFHGRWSWFHSLWLGICYCRGQLF